VVSARRILLSRTRNVTSISTVEEGERGGVGGEGVGAAEADDGEGDGHAQGLVPLDGVAHAGDRMAGEVQAVAAPLP
jgi:hypothetical protein